MITSESTKAPNAAAKRMTMPYAVGDRVKLVNTPTHLEYEGVTGTVLGYHGSPNLAYAGHLFLIIGYDLPVAGTKAGVWIKSCVEKVES